MSSQDITILLYPVIRSCGDLANGDLGNPILDNAFLVYHEKIG